MACKELDISLLKSCSDEAQGNVRPDCLARISNEGSQLRVERTVDPMAAKSTTSRHLDVPTMFTAAFFPLLQLAVR
jgi:hypothetical protein